RPRIVDVVEAAADADVWAEGVARGGTEGALGDRVVRRALDLRHVGLVAAPRCGERAREGVADLVAPFPEGGIGNVVDLAELVVDVAVDPPLEMQVLAADHALVE